MTSLALTLPLSRRSPAITPRRDLFLSNGDSLGVALTLVQTDRPDADPVDLSGLGPRVRMTLWSAVLRCDYGLTLASARAVAAVDGVVTDAPAGKVALTIDHNVLRTYQGRLGWSIQLDYSDPVTTLAWGVVNLRAGPLMADASVPLLDENGTPITTENDVLIEV